jgi:hypothetical protein
MPNQNYGESAATPKAATGPTGSERLRIVIAFFLLAIGFGLTVIGWYSRDDHLYHLGLTLGPAGLIVLAFEYLVRINLDTRHLQKLIELDRRHAVELDEIKGETVGSLQRTAAELRQIATFDLDRGELGLVGIYANRADAVRFAVAPMIEEEKEGIYLVGSTIFGLGCDVQEGSRRIVLTSRGLIEQIAKRKAKGCEIRILLTHPSRIFERHAQESGVRSAERGTIASELRDACRLLADHNLADCTKLYNGSPTCFTIVFKGQRRMIINPYPYESEAYNSWAIMIEDRERGIYKPFLESHVEGPWNNKNLAVPLTKHFTKQLKQAEAQELTFADEAAAMKSRLADKTDEMLSDCLPKDTTEELTVKQVGQT